MSRILTLAFCAAALGLACQTQTEPEATPAPEPVVVAAPAPEPVAAVVVVEEPAPVLPKTASAVPLVGLLGAGALGLGMAMRIARRGITRNR